MQFNNDSPYTTTEKRDYLYWMVIFFLPIFVELLASWLLHKPLLNLALVFPGLGYAHGFGFLLR